MSYPKLRLFTDKPLNPDARLQLSDQQTHYLQHVMRAQEGTPLALFNGQDGEWHATITRISKRETEIKLDHLLRAQAASPDLWLLFAPIKRDAVDWLGEKATELGASVLQPVFTKHTAVGRINTDRLRANAIEAAEQTERLDIPECREAQDLVKILGSWPEDRTLIFCDESGKGEPPSECLLPLKGKKLAVLIGPEGGFSQSELDMLRALPYARAMTLGPRILKADTAALASLTIIQAYIGDWNAKPAFRAQG